MKPIGVFDSGIGGLTVVKELKRQLPAEDIVYFGDTAHLPYGTKSADTIIRFTLDNIIFLLKKDVKVIIVACNTASSLALPAIRKHFRVPIVGVIQPGARQAAEITKTNQIGVIGTKSTISSNAYERELKRINPKIKVISKACPLFVSLVEEGWFNNSTTKQITREYLFKLKSSHGIDTLILGCTHYPLLKSVISRFMGKDVKLVDSARQVVKEVSSILKLYNCNNKSKKHKGLYRFYVSDDPRGFMQQAVRFLGYTLSNVKKINHV